MCDLEYNIPERNGDPLGTYERSGWRLDYILGTPGTQQAVIGGGLLSYNDGIESDHRAIFIDFKVNVLLEKFDEMTPKKCQKVHSAKPLTISKYI